MDLVDVGIVGPQPLEPLVDPGHQMLAGLGRWGRVTPRR